MMDLVPFCWDTIVCFTILWKKMSKYWLTNYLIGIILLIKVRKS